MVKAVIFDYNGTLYYDYDINLGGWELFYKDFYKKEEGAKEFAEVALGHNNRINVINAYKSINKTPSEEEITMYSIKKESFYHQLAIDNKRFALADGVDKLLDYLKQKGIKVNMCTASIKYNVDFYFEITNLSNWFDKEIVSYDDGVCDGKVEMYQRAAKNINVDIKDCIVFEDTINGIKDAIKAGYQKIVYVNHYNKPKIDAKEVIQEIHEYSQLDYSIFE